MKALELMVKFGRKIEGIVHVGANRGQEAVYYRSLGSVPCIYIEPIPEVFQLLQREISLTPRHYAVRAVCSDQDAEEVVFNIADNQGEASSMFDASAHLEFFPHVKFTNSLAMQTTTLDKVIENFPGEDFNLLVIDTQGAELKVLRGASKSIARFDGIFLEVAEVPLYVGGATFDDVQQYLRSLGFLPKWLEMNQFHYGDAFFLREPSAAVLPEAPGENLALGRPAEVSSVWEGASAATAQKGNNGERTGDFGFHTAEQDDPWWQVDLTSVQRLREIRIFNRLTSGSERAKTLQVRVSQNGSDWALVHDQNGRRFGGIDGNPLRIELDLDARYVRVSSHGKTFLHLDEIEIY